MAEDPTRQRRVTGLPIKTVRLEIIAGPDAGLTFVSQDDVLTVGSAEGNDVRLRDPTVSRYHLEIGRRADRIRVTDLGSTNGTMIGTAMVEGSTVSVAPGATIEIGDTTLRLADGNVVVVDTSGPDALDELRAQSPSMKRLFKSIARVAKSKVPVLVVGESGTGKELIAKAIHSLADPAQPFATVDCAATVPTLFASELFGHERGAFTGADRRHEGAFSRASGGTIFLDEIGELSLDLQSTLLGVVERRRFRRVGGSEEIPVDVRIVSATHRDLRSEVNAGRFRLDLYYRLAVVSLSVPPLRERVEDLPLLIAHLLREAGHDGPIEDVFSREVLAAFAQHTWPGNVRELRNVVESALVMGGSFSMPGTSTPGPSVADGDLASSFAPLREMSYREARRTLLDRFEQDYLKALLAKSGGNVRQAARDSRMDRSYLIQLLRRHGIGQTGGSPT